MSEQQYGLTYGGAVVAGSSGPVISGPLNAAPGAGDFAEDHPEGCKWLPVRNVDAAGFDPERNWRGAPVYRVAGDVVERVYPGVPKAPVDWPTGDAPALTLDPSKGCSQ